MYSNICILGELLVKFYIHTMQATLMLIVFSVAAGCSADCDVQEYINGVGTLQLWAMQSLLYLNYLIWGGTQKNYHFLLKVLDSSSKLPGDGILDGTFLIQVGNYDQCLATAGPKDDGSGMPKFKGKYCIFQPEFHGPLSDVLNDTIATLPPIQMLLQQTAVG
jgi:hypothetical protein